MLEWPGAQAHPVPAQAPAWLALALGLMGDWCARERLAALFWPDAGDAAALRSLRVTLHRSRQWLEGLGLGAALQSGPAGLRLALDSDVAEFRRAIGQGAAEHAVALQREPLLPGFLAAAFPVFEEWLGAEREVLRGAWREAVLREAARRDALGELATALATLQQAVDDDPLAEVLVHELHRLASRTPEGHPARAAALQRAQRQAQALRLDVDTDALPATAASSASPSSHSAAPWTRDRMAPWVGREEAMATLQATDADLLIVSGEPGVGKTRLLAEFAPEQPGRTLWLRGRQGLQSVPLLPVAEALQRELPRLRTLLGRDATLRELSRLVPALADGELLPAPDAASAALLTALLHVLPRLADTLVVDDLQWLDTATRQLLGLLAGAAPMRLLATLRGAEAPADLGIWLQAEQAAGRCRVWTLPPWSATDTAALLARLSGRPAPRFALWVHARCGGNPLFVLETLRWLFEQGRLRLAEDGWASDLDEIQPDYRNLVVPDRVAALLQQRVAALSGNTQRLLQAAAVVGSTTPLEAVAALVPLHPWDAAEALAEAQHAGLMAAERFAHDLVREAILAAMAPPVARLLHAGVLCHLAAHLPPHRLAEHAWAAGDEPAAVKATLAASQADRLLGLFEIARPALAAARARCTATRSQAALQAEMADLADSLGDVDVAEAQARGVLELDADPADHANAITTLARMALDRGNLPSARQWTQVLLAEHPECPDRFTLPAKLAHAEGDFEAALVLMRQQVQWLRATPETPPSELASALSGLAVSLDALGRETEAAALHLEALSEAARVKSRYIQVYATANWLHSFKGAPDEALGIGEAALSLGEYRDSHRLRLQLAARYIDAARWRDAERHLEPVCDDKRPVYVAYARARLVTVQAALGDPTARRAAIERAFEAASASDDYRAHAMVAASVLHDGDDADQPRAQALLRPERHSRLDPSLRQRLAEGMAKRGCG